MNQNFPSRRHFLKATSAISLFGMSNLTHAQAKVDQLKIYVPLPPGGTSDLLARIVAEGMREVYASSVQVHNQAGAGGRIGITKAKDMKPDGTEILITPASTMVLYPHVFNEIKYDPIKDFTPLAKLTSSPFCIAIGPAVPEAVNSLTDFIAWCNENPTSAAFGSPAAGSAPHLLAMKFGKSMRVPFLPVAFNGGGPNLIALLGGQVALAFIDYGVIRPHIQSGKLRVLAVTGTKRLADLQSIPTVQEAGFEQLVHDEWYGAFGPKGMSSRVIDDLSSSIEGAMKIPRVAALLGERGIVAGQDSRPEYVTTMKRDLIKWSEVVRSLGFTPI